MAQALDALQKPKLLVDTEDIIAEHTAKLSRCEIDLDTAAQTIIDRCGSLLDGISVPESVSKFFFPCNVGVNSGTGNCPAVPNRPLAPEVSPSLTSGPQFSFPASYLSSLFSLSQTLQVPALRSFHR